VEGQKKNAIRRLNRDTSKINVVSDDRKVIIIAGPNGAGKTTFAREFLPLEAGLPVSACVREVITSHPKSSGDDSLSVCEISSACIGIKWTTGSG
jgi:ABC-type transport system involved in cytochrome c biogenesis ATPase subunit